MVTVTAVPKSNILPIISVRECVPKPSSHRHALLWNHTRRSESKPQQLPARSLSINKVNASPRPLQQGATGDTASHVGAIAQGSHSGA